MVTKNDVFRMIRLLGFSSETAISKELGYSKKNKKVSEFITELLSEGLIEMEYSGNYMKYSISDCVTDEEFSVFDSSDLDIPITESQYIAQTTSKGYKITDPNGNVTYLSKTEMCLIINERKKFIIKKLQDPFLAIQRYAKKFGYENVFITDVSFVIPIKSTDRNPCMIFVTVQEFV